jgi:hypothetical protein
LAWAFPARADGPSSARLAGFSPELGPVADNRGGQPKGRQGGENCGNATVIGTLPYQDTGTTSGHLDDYDESCPDSSWGAPDVAYSYTPAADITVDISLCHPQTDYDTKLYVYEGGCPGALVACNDDACPGYVSQILDLALAANTTYFIIVDGYGAESGNYKLTVSASNPPSPTCPDGSLVSQPASVEGQATAGISEQSAGYLRYENYTCLESKPISKVRFWGLSLHWDGASWSACSEDPMTFQVKFYPDVGGLPGAAVYSEDLSLDAADTGLLFNGYPLHQYEGTLSPACSQNSGWVSIQGIEGPNCWFLWMSSPDGDHSSLVDDGTGPVFKPYDLSLCLTAGQSVCVGDLNCDGQIDFKDINPFVQYLSNFEAWQNTYPGCNPLNGDINGDGIYGFGSFKDINPFVTLLASAPLPIPCP